MTTPSEPTAATINVTIKADTRSFRRGLIRAELGMPGRYGPGLMRRLRLRWQLWKVNREPAP